MHPSSSFLLVSLSIGMCSIAALADAQAPVPARAPFTLTVTERAGVADITLNAQDAPLEQVAAELGRRLNARFSIGASLAGERVTTRINTQPLETALPALAPRVAIDYEIRGGTATRALDVYLLGRDDTPPALNIAPRGTQQGFVVFGHTEDVAPTSGRDPLTIEGDRNRMTITADQQALAVILMVMAEHLGVQLEMPYAPDRRLNLEFRNARPEDILSRLGPEVIVDIRADLNTGARSIFRLAVAAPTP